jgi:DNA repair protein RadC
MDEKKLSIKNWAEDDRPREKMMKKGISSLSNAELIAILFGTGTRNESAVELARKLLDNANNNLNELAKQELKQLCKIKGIGEAKAMSILTALELGKRRNVEEVIQRRKISSSKDAIEIFGPMLRDLPHEEFWILMLNRSNVIIDKMRISQGGITGTVTDIKLILKSALDNMASSIILCHNHPSGNKSPSDADMQLTKKIKEGSKLLDIVILDHVIIANDKYYSFADEGILE